MQQTNNKVEQGNKAHEEIPGNPSTATSSSLNLNDRSNGKPLRVLGEDDRANLNFPLPAGVEKKGFIHWDYDPETKPQNVQGVLALADQDDENMGGFQCIPWLYRNYDTWKLTQPEDRDRFQPSLEGLEDKIVKVKMEAGDLLIFNSTEPHGIRPNKSKDKVRIAQYISMMPAEPENEVLKNWRINSWKNRIAPEGYAFPGDPRNWEQTKYEEAELTDLGKKLLGLNDW